MMRPTTWIIMGLALNGAAAVLHGPDVPTAADLAQTVPYYLPSVVLAAAGQYCLYRAARGLIRDVWRGLWGANRTSSGGIRPAPAKTFAAPEPASDFDPDQAFARYMERRKAMGEEAGETQDAAPLPPPAAAARATGGFGRRVV